MTQTVEETTAVRQTDEPGDHDRFAHYADKDKITEAYILGSPVRAICGKLWVPNRDPKRYKVCPKCKEIYERLPKE